MTGECQTFFLRSPRRWRRQKGVGGVGGMPPPPPPPPFSSFFLFADSLLKEIRFPVGKGGGWVVRKGGRGEFIPLWCIYSPKRRAEVAIFCCCFFKKKKKKRGTGEYIGGAIFSPTQETDRQLNT